MVTGGMGAEERMEHRHLHPAQVEFAGRSLDESADYEKTLGEIEDATATPALGEAAGGDSDAEVRGTAAWALGQIGARGAPPGLIRAVNDADEDVRTRAAWALSEIGDTVAIPALRQALRTEKDGTARRAQLRALVRSGERSEEFFRDLLRSEDPDVRAEAVRGMAGRGHSNPWPWPMPRPRPFP